uniref:Uncharacterized protein n=1 Tax=Chromera velia CCMP2878 TaxID=1169474 RepID=A0A0G4G5T7_9ALVE|eukprot:Cvel_20389.t1-p1 / transcript=Cvel_20389.t1 / gene=Cvel_20389 / organism=Chromera_velia_CCMP2878 / gene_product=hypothetical protein / transcript_product=hypothetical protein / location=Cvel_scaffold1825:24315-24764(+) / protein_length=150 / sequence_SO=supercontig / SO=protein_coding / is_pseudo=false
MQVRKYYLEELWHSLVLKFGEGLEQHWLEVSQYKTDEKSIENFLEGFGTTIKKAFGPRGAPLMKPKPRPRMIIASEQQMCDMVADAHIYWTGLLAERERQARRASLIAARKRGEAPEEGEGEGEGDNQKQEGGEKKGGEAVSVERVDPPN